MTRNRNLAIIRKLQALEGRRAQLIERLSANEPLLVGSLSRVRRTCGKPTCHCTVAPAHEAWVLATNRDSRRRCQVVRLADVQEVRERVANYKSFRKVLRELEAIDRDEKALLRGLMETRNMPYD